MASLLSSEPPARPAPCRRVGQWLLNLLFPPSCLLCRQPLQSAGHLCGGCFSRLHFLHGACCKRCGIPFAHPVEDMACAACQAAPPLFDQARAVCRYDEASKPLILRLKYSDQQQLAPALAQWMQHAAGDWLREADVIIPVPLHRWRLARRMFNQSALLAELLSRRSGIPAASGLLIRQRRTRKQQGLSRPQRRKNMRNAFALAPTAQETLRGKHILLIDDVFTTGATVTACTRTLKSAGAASVKILTFARTL